MNSLGAAGTPFLFLLDFELRKPIVLPLSEINPDLLRYQIGTHTNHDGKLAKPPINGDIQLSKQAISFAAYKKGFDQVLAEIKLGNSFLLNYCIHTPIEVDLSLQDIYAHTKARYHIWLNDQFVCFSPEAFVRINAQGQIASYPMKGTIDATLPDAATQLLDNEKERAEHYTIVDLIRNDLSMVATQVRVERFRYLEPINTHQGQLLQASSEVNAVMRKSWKSKLGSIFKRLLPAGSISGAPKKRTLQIIQAAEAGPRGYYTGICGVFDGTSLDSGVMIRFIEQTKTGLVFRSGGGITCMSDAQSEYEECIAKVYLPLA
jgi:para-aminobenzoate synthetase component I